jgi:nitrate/nitrite-specific signal transduction histidine kinase
MLDRAAARNDEVGQLARTFQGMGRQIVERERRLREQVNRLTVEIDQSKVDEEVQLITETDYFQHLKARAKELRQRDEGRPHD